MKSFLLLCLTPFFFSTSFALSEATGSHFKSVAIPFESLIVRPVLAAHLGYYKPADILSTSYGQQLYIRPFARAFLLELHRAGYKIKLLTHLGQEVASNLASEILISKDENLNLSQIAQFVPLNGKSLVEPNIVGESEAPTTFFLTDSSLTVASQTQSLFLGYARSPSPPPFIPKAIRTASEREEYLDANNLARAHVLLGLILRGSLVDSFRQIRTIIDAEAEEQTKAGILYLQDAHLSIKYEFLRDSESGKYQGCERTDFKSRTKSKVPLLECINQTEGLTYAFKNLKKSACAAYDSELVEITSVELRKCSDQVVIKHPKSAKNIKIQAFQGMESLSEEAFLKKITDFPTRTAPYKFFEPWNIPAKKDHLNYMACLKTQGGRNLQGFDRSTGTLHESCKLDTLYSWGPQEKLNILIQQMGQNEWGRIKTIFASRGPISTFGYGPIAIRIKLKKETKFKEVSWMRCDFAETPEAKTTVYVRVDNSYADWSICHPAVIHSWSYDTPEHYDEMMKEYLQHRSLLASGVGILGRIEVYGQNRQSSSLFSSNIDSHDFSEAGLIQRFQSMLLRIEQNTGKIHFNPDLPANEKTREAHFKTSYPTYFNEN